MTLEQAYNVLENVTAQVNASRQVHAQVVEALTLIKKLIQESTEKKNG